MRKQQFGEQQHADSDRHSRCDEHADSDACNHPVAHAGCVVDNDNDDSDAQCRRHDAGHNAHTDSGALRIWMSETAQRCAVDARSKRLGFGDRVERN